MEKLLYWLKKLGIMRTSSYSVKGDAKKLVEMDATDGGMIQSQKQIDEEHAQKQAQKPATTPDPHSESGSGNTPEEGGEGKSGKGGKILFWILVVFAVLFLLIFLSSGLSIWFLIAAIMWVFLMKKVWVGSVTGTLALGKMIGISVVVIIVSLFLADAALPTAENMDNGLKDNIGNMKSDSDEDDEEMIVDDAVTTFLKGLQKETKIEFSKPVDDDVTRPAANVSLDLTDAKSFASEGLSRKDFDRIQEFFLDQDADDGGIGFTFVPPAGTKSSGFALPYDGDYRGLMCVLVAVENDGVLIGCGWGPGGGE